MSSTNYFHHKAMDLAALAFMERAKGNLEDATGFFEQALENEIAAISALDEYVEPTYSVLHRSAATLALDCNQYRMAERLAEKALAKEPPLEIAEELRDVLEQAQISFRRRLADPNFLQIAPGRLMFGGRPVIGQHGILADFGSKALTAFEKAVASVGAGQAGNLRWMGPIPNRDEYRLLITGIAHGSFGFQFEGASAGARTASAVEMVIRILQASVEIQDNHELADLLGDFNRRAIKDVCEFLEIVAKNEAICALEFGDANMSFYDTRQVQHSAERLSRIESEEVVEFMGQFIGFLPYRGRVEFLVDETGEVINMAAERPVVEFAETHLDRPVKVTARRRQIGMAKPHYTFLNIRVW